MPTGWDSILTVISFGDCYTDGLEMLLYFYLRWNKRRGLLRHYVSPF